MAIVDLDKLIDKREVAIETTNYAFALVIACALLFPLSIYYNSPMALILCLLCLIPIVFLWKVKEINIPISIASASQDKHHYYLNLSYKVGSRQLKEVIRRNFSKQNDIVIIPKTKVEQKDTLGLLWRHNGRTYIDGVDISTKSGPLSDREVFY